MASKKTAQEHFYLEPNTALVMPGERGSLNVYCSSQGVTQVQQEISRVLGVGQHKVHVHVVRIGGGFGGKESSNVLITTPCAVVATMSVCTLDDDFQ